MTRTDALLTPRLALRLGPSQVTHALFSDFLPHSLHLCAAFFFLPRLLLFSTNARSLPSPLTSLTLAVCQGFTSKLMIGFLTVQQAVFYPALCEETKIISMNMEKPACMVISNPVISISVKPTWLNLTYIQTDGDTLFQSPLGSESHCKH